MTPRSMAAVALLLLLLTGVGLALAPHQDDGEQLPNSLSLDADDAVGEVTVAVNASISIRAVGNPEDPDTYFYVSAYEYAGSLSLEGGSLTGTANTAGAIVVRIADGNNHDVREYRINVRLSLDVDPGIENSLSVTAGESLGKTFYVYQGGSISIADDESYFVKDYWYNGSHESGLSTSDGGLFGTPQVVGEVIVSIKGTNNLPVGSCRIKVVSYIEYAAVFGNPDPIGGEQVREIQFSANGGNGGYVIYVPAGYDFWFPMEGEFEDYNGLPHSSGHNLDVHAPIYRSGYYLAGWSTSDIASEPDALPGDKGTAANGSVVYYAVWESALEEDTIVMCLDSEVGNELVFSGSFGSYSPYSAELSVIERSTGFEYTDQWTDNAHIHAGEVRSAGWVKVDLKNSYTHTIISVHGTPDVAGTYDVRLHNHDSAGNSYTYLWHVSVYDDHRAVALSGPDNPYDAQYGALTLSYGDEGFVYYLDYGSTLVIDYTDMGFVHAVPTTGFGLTENSGTLTGSLSKVGRLDVNLHYPDLLGGKIAIMSVADDAYLTLGSITVTGAHAGSQKTVPFTCASTPAGADITYTVSNQSNVTVTRVGTTLYVTPDAAGQCSFKLTASAPGYTGDERTVTFIADNLGASDPDFDAYAITNVTAIRVPGTAAPSSVTLAKDGATVTGFSVGVAYNGLTVAAGTGAVTGTPSAPGEYVFEMFYGSAGSRTVTVVVEDQIPSDTNIKTSVESKTGQTSILRMDDTEAWGEIDSSGMKRSIELVYLTSKSAYLYRTANFQRTLSSAENVLATYGMVGQGVKNTVAGYAMVEGHNGGSYAETEIAPSITGSVNYIGLSATDGDLVAGPYLPAGTYDVRLRLSSGLSDSRFQDMVEGCEWALPSSNYGDHVVRVKETVAITASMDDAEFWMATNGDYRNLTLSSSLGADAKFTVTSYGSLSSGKISVSQNGVVTPGSTRVTEVGTYVLTIKVVDKNNSSNYDTGILTVHVVHPFGFTNNMDGTQFGW